MITLLKKDLEKVAKFLVGIELSGVESIHRMRIVNVLKKEHEEMVKEEVELLKAHAELDENGDLLRTEGGGFRLKDKGTAAEFREQQAKLVNEPFVIDSPNYKQAIETLEDIVMNLDQKLSNEDAETHFLIVEAFEQAKNDKGDEE